MVYEPYVGGQNKNNNNNNNNTQQQSGNSYGNPSTSYGASAGNSYGTPATNSYGTPVGNSYGTPSGYQPASAVAAPAATSSSYSSGYQPSSSTSSNYSGYSPAPAPAVATSSYSSGYAPAPAVATATATTPFSHSLSSSPPPPQAQAIPAVQARTNNTNVGSSYGSGSGTTYGGGAGVAPATKTEAFAVAVPAGAASAINSSVYQGGPTNGLVSEGNPVKCHKVDYEIKGHEMQLVEIELDPDEAVIAEAGAMMFLDDGIEFKSKMGDGSEPKQGFFKKLLSAGGRLMTGESLFMTHFKNKGTVKARVAFAAPYPGTVIPINLANIGEKLICQKDAFVCAALGTKVSIHFNKKIGSGLFGGEGFILQKLKGDGMVFIHAGGTIIKRELRGERLRLDTGCLVAFTEGINYDIQLVPGLKSILFGGEGLFLATLQGHGTVWMQSLPFSRMCDRIVQSAPSIGGRRQGEGSALTGGLGDMLDGDGFGHTGGLGAFRI